MSGKGERRRIKNFKKANEGNLHKQLKGKAPRGIGILPQVSPAKVADLKSIPRGLRMMLDKKRYLEQRDKGLVTKKNRNKFRQQGPGVAGQGEPSGPEAEASGDESGEEGAASGRDGQPGTSGRGDGGKAGPGGKGVASAPVKVLPPKLPKKQRHLSATDLFADDHKGVNSKRKEYLKKRDAKRKNKQEKRSEESDDKNWQKREHIKLGETVDNVPKFNLKRRHWAEQASAEGRDGDALPRLPAKASKYYQSSKADKLKNLFLKQMNDAKARSGDAAAKRPRLDAEEQEAVRSQVLSHYRSRRPEAREGIATVTTLKDLARRGV